MHVCGIGYRIYPPLDEGMTITTFNLLNALREYTNIDVSIISSCSNNSQLFKDVLYAKQSPINRILKGTRFHEFEHDYFMNAQMIRLLFKLNKEKKIDIVHIFFASHTIFSLAARYLKIPVVAQLFGGVKHLGLLKAFRTFNRIDAYITTSAIDAKDLLSMGVSKEKIYKINPIIRSDMLKPVGKLESRAYFDLPKDAFIIAYMGNLKHERFPLQLVKEIKRLKTELGRDDIILFIISRPLPVNKSWGNLIKKCAASLNIMDNVILKIETIQEAEKVLILNTPDVFIFPFQQSILNLQDRVVIDPPITMLEAMSCGKLVIASNILSIPYIIKDGINGFLVEPGDLEGLKQKIIEVVEGNYDTRTIEENARKTIVRDFHPKEVALKVKGIYKEVIGCQS